MQTARGVPQGAPFSFPNRRQLSTLPAAGRGRGVGLRHLQSARCRIALPAHRSSTPRNALARVPQLAPTNQRSTDSTMSVWRICALPLRFAKKPTGFIKEHYMTPSLKIIPAVAILAGSLGLEIG